MDGMFRRYKTSENLIKKIFLKVLWLIVADASPDLMPMFHCQDEQPSLRHSIYFGRVLWKFKQFY